MTKHNKVLLGLAVVAVLAGLCTMIPNADASMVNLLGYKSNCPMTPVSSIITILIGLVFWGMSRMFSNREE